MHHISRKLVAVILVIVLVVVSIEAYAFSYVNVSNLQIVNIESASKFPAWFNESYMFSSDGAQWLILFQLAGDNIGISSYALFYIFKVAQNLSLVVLNTNLVPQKFWVSTPTNEGVLNDDPYFTSTNSYRCINNNCTFAKVEYTAFSGTHNVDYAFTFRVYETTLVGIVPLNEATVHFNGTINIPY